MNHAIITAGGIGDIFFALKAATLIEKIYDKDPTIFVNSHQEIVDFINKCTDFEAILCPPRENNYKDTEHPYNLPKSFIDDLTEKYTNVYTCWPDSLGEAPLAFPWQDFVRNYRAFLQTQVKVNAGTILFDPKIKNIFLHMTSVTLEKNYPLPKLQALVNLFNKHSDINVIICRTSQWKGMPLPFYLNAKYTDLCDEPIEKVVATLNSCDYCVGIDSSMSHVAYHLQIPRIVLQYRYREPYHIARYHEDPLDDMPLESSHEAIYNRVILNLKDTLTQAIPAYLQFPHTIDTKQLLFKKDFH